MKLLAFSDIHRDLDAVRALADRAGGVDVLVGAGDFATKREGLRPVIDAIAALATPAVLVHGNGESEDELLDACAPYAHLHPLHGASIELGGRTFFGLGGGVPVTPFGAWSVDYTEAQAVRWLSGCPLGAVLVTHSPPYGHADVTSAGESVGSRSVLACIERARPTHVFCGHIHDSWGVTSRAGDTLVMNLGPRGVEVDLGAG